MARNYHIYHLTDEEKAQKIKERVLKTSGVHYVWISKDLKELDIVADEDRFSEIMEKVVNICRKISPSCELAYMF